MSPHLHRVVVALCLVGLIGAARAGDTQAVELVQVIGIQHLLVRPVGPMGALREVRLATLQADLQCVPQQHLSWVRRLFPPGTPLWVEPAAGRAPLRVWLHWRGQPVDWSLLLLRLGHGLLPAEGGRTGQPLLPYLEAVREARAEGRGIWGECGRRRSRFGAAARASGVPELLLLAMALCESGRGRQPWPWTLNVAGQSYFFLTRKAALRRLEQLQSQHFDLVDIGLMQVNWHYHHDRFRNIAEALDPEVNQVVAAGILREHLQRTGNLHSAIARYHSADPVLGGAYLAAVLRVAQQEQQEQQAQRQEQGAQTSGSAHPQRSVD